MKKTLLYFILFVTLFALFSCKDEKVEDTYYTITWKNVDGTVLKKDLVKEGEVPVYSGETPVLEDDDNYSYLFLHWEPEITKAYSDKVYFAVYYAMPKSDDGPGGFNIGPWDFIE